MNRFSVGSTRWLFILITLVIGYFLTFLPAACAQPSNEEEDAFILETLSWMTFRKNGVLLTKDQLQTKWLDHVKTTPVRFIGFRILTMYFQFGLFLKLTLNENEPCDPTYQNHYKYWYNDSVSDYYFNIFVVNNYYHQYYPSGGPAPMYPSAYCDFRKGLVCSRTTSKCQCPPGSIMSKLQNAPFPPDERCLLKENEVCALLDDADNNGVNEPFKSAISYMMLYPERPLGCVDGTQCRFKASNLVTPLCYSSASNPSWVNGTDKIEYGQECTLSLYANHGMCNELTCYNYGLPSSLVNGAINKTGICIHHKGVFGGHIKYASSSSSSSNNGPWFHKFNPYFGGLVVPPFVPMRGDKLFKYQEVLYNVSFAYFHRHAFGYGWGSLVSENQPNSCSVSRTNQLIDIYRFFESLRHPPGPGKFVADEAKLMQMLEQAKSVVKEGLVHSSCCVPYYDLPKICQISGKGSEFSGYGARCIASGDEPDEYGNDGKCSQPFNETRSFHDNFHKPYIDLFNRNDHFSGDIHCEKCWRIYHEVWGIHRHIDPYDMEKCRTDYDWRCWVDDSEEGRCGEYYGDNHRASVFQDYSCNFVSTHRIRNRCNDHSDAAHREHGACESVVLEEKVEQVLEEMFAKGSYKKLRLGAKCNYETESVIRQALLDVGSLNGYKFLKFFNKDSISGGLCDMTKLLECKSDNKCDCIDGAETRITEVRNVPYRSSYCYLTYGPCNANVTRIIPLLFPDEKDEVLIHYGNFSVFEQIDDYKDDTEDGYESDYEYEDDNEDFFKDIDKRVGKDWRDPPKIPCHEGNTCLFLNRDDKCTQINTGFTGVDVAAKTTTTTEKNGDSTDPTHDIVFPFPDPVTHSPNRYRHRGATSALAASGFCLSLWVLLLTLFT